MDAKLNMLVEPDGGKIVLVVIDGLGGVRTDERGSELHAARTPHLDALAAEGSSGLHNPVGPGITAGSGAGHLALFGYDPVEFELGRGALSAAGVGFDLKPGDVAARVNLCTLDSSGRVSDRRAGRISTEENRRICNLITSSVSTGGRTELFLEPEREHRALLVLRGERLSHLVTDTDPQRNGLFPLTPSGLSDAGQETANLLANILDQVKQILKGEPANFVLLRGFDTARELPRFADRYRMKPVAIAGYPMYLGITRLLGFETAPPRQSPAEVVGELRSRWTNFDFFYLHHKGADAAGEDGDFERKVMAIEDVDATIPEIKEAGPAVICVTGDHATPSQLGSHSWHPVPFLMWGELVGRDRLELFDEEAAGYGGLGRIEGRQLMPLMLAAARRLKKYGA